MFARLGFFGIVLNTRDNLGNCQKIEESVIRLSKMNVTNYGYEYSQSPTFLCTIILNFQKIF